MGIITVNQNNMLDIVMFSHEAPFWLVIAKFYKTNRLHRKCEEGTKNELKMHQNFETKALGRYSTFFFLLGQNFRFSKIIGKLAFSKCVLACRMYILMDSSCEVMESFYQCGHFIYLYTRTCEIFNFVINFLQKFSE